LSIGSHGEMCKGAGLGGVKIAPTSKINKNGSKSMEIHDKTLKNVFRGTRVPVQRPGCCISPHTHIGSR